MERKTKNRMRLITLIVFSDFLFFLSELKGVEFGVLEIESQFNSLIQKCTKLRIPIPRDHIVLSRGGYWVRVVESET